MPGPQSQRGSDALVGEGGRKPHVEEAELGHRLLDGLLEGPRVRQGGDHLVAGVLQDADEPFAQQDGVLADQDAHGTLTSRDVGPPWGLSSRAVPPAARTRFMMPSRPPPGVTCAPPIPSSSTRAHRLPSGR